MTLKSHAKSGLENDMRNLANVHQNTWKWQNWEFDGILLSKVDVTTPKSDEKFEEELTCCFKTDMRNWTNFDSSTRKSKKCKMFQVKKNRGVTFDGTEDWCKIWRKTELRFQKWHEEFGKFSPEHLKVSKLGLWWDPF